MQWISCRHFDVTLREHIQVLPHVQLWSHESCYVGLSNKQLCSIQSQMDIIPISIKQCVISGSATGTWGQYPLNVFLSIACQNIKINICKFLTYFAWTTKLLKSQAYCYVRAVTGTTSWFKFFHCSLIKPGPEQQLEQPGGEKSLTAKSS